MAATLLLSIVLTMVPVGAAAAESGFDAGRYNLVWETPSVKQDDSMPLGNGEVGLNMWMENESDLVFYISRVGAYANDSTTMKLGKIRIAFPEGTFTDKDFSQTLDLPAGSIKVLTGQGDEEISLELWIDANAPVIHVKGESAKEIPVAISYELGWRTLTMLAETPAGNAASEDVLLDDGSDAVTWYHKNSKSTWKSQAKARQITSEESLSLDPVENLTFGGSIKAEGMERTSASTLSSAAAKAIDIKIDIHAEQTENPQTFVKRLRENTRESDAVPYEDSYQKHSDWWKEYWNNSYIEITDGTFKKPERYTGSEEDIGYTITQNYLLQRFLQGAALRADQLVPFNGSIFNVQNKGGYTTGSPDERMWDGLPIMWQNTRSPYWATLSSGDFEQTRTLIDFLHRSLPVLKEAAKNRFGVEGAYLAEPMMPNGVPASAYTLKHLTNHFTATAEIPLMMVRYYNFTGDDQLFEEKILPVTEACLDFLNNRYNKNDANGKMIMYPANSLESGIDATNPSSIIGPMTALLDELLALPSGSLSPEQMKKFVTMRNRMPEISTRELDGVTFLAQEEKRNSFYHGVESPELYPVWPSNLYGPSSQSEDIGIARQTYAARTKYWNLFGDTGKVDTTGGWNQSTLFASKLGLPYEASYLMTMCALNCIDEFSYPGLPAYGTIPARFPAFWGPYYDWIPDQCHGGNVTNGLQSLLLQYDSDNNIYLLPSWPEDWDVNFKLHGPKNTVITGSYKDGALDYATNNGYGKITDLSGYEERVINRVSVACADQNEVFREKVNPASYYEQMPDGKYDETNLDQYAVTKDWLEKYGPSLNGTTGTAYGWNDWGGVTADMENGKVYFHLVGFDGTLTIPNLLPDLENAECLTNPDAAVEVVQNSSEITITMDAADADPLDTIICMDAKVPDPVSNESKWVNDDSAEIIYSGAWTHETDRNYGEYQKDIHQGWANSGSEIEYTFEGTGIEVLATTGGKFGTLEISVDGDNVKEVSLDSAAAAPQKTIYALHALEKGSHTVKITSKAGAKQYVTFDAFVVYQSEIDMVNDDDGRIGYSEGWTHEMGRKYGEYKDDIHQTRGNNGATAIYEFYGTGIEAICTRGGGFAKLEFQVDNFQPQVVEIATNNVARFGETVFSRMNLQPGMHTIRIKSLSAKANQYVAFDAFRVIKPGEVKSSDVVSASTPPVVGAEYGTAFDDLALPDEVEVALQNGRKLGVGVEWLESGFDGNSSGTYEIKGLLKNLPEGVENTLEIDASIQVAVALNPDRSNPRVRRLDDTDPAILYEGAWTPQIMEGYNYYKDTQHYTMSIGDSFSVKFEGTGIQYITYLDFNRGEVEIFLDGESMGIVDLRSDVSTSQGIGYEAQGLAYGEHTLKGVMISGNYFTVDAVDIYNDEGLRYITAVEGLGQIGCKLNETVSGLPETVEVTVDGKETEEFAVEWNTDGLDTSKAGLYAVEGNLVIPQESNLVNNSGLKARLNVYVSETGLPIPGEMKLELENAEGKLGEAYAGSIKALGGTAPYQCAIYGLPGGLEAKGDGTISGTPSEAGVFHINALVKDGRDKLAFETFPLSIDPNIIVTNVAVSPAGATVAKGASQQFTAVVEGKNNPPQAVTWKVSADAQTAAGTQIGEGGMLNVAANEPNNALTVTATSVQDETVSGTVQVMLADIPAAMYQVKVVNGTGEGTYQPGDMVTAEADVAPEGKRFSTWVCPDLPGTDLSANPLTFIMPEHDVSLEAVYVPDSGTEYPVNPHHRGQIYAGGDEGLAIQVNAPFEKFIGASVDNIELINGRDMKVSEGSTIVTLQPSFLKTLQPGEHTLNVIFTDGYATTTFTVAESGGSETPGAKPPGGGEAANGGGEAARTGDDAPLLMMLILAAIALCVLTGTIIYRKLKRQ